MENLLNEILSDKRALILALLVLSLIIYFILKRLVKLIILAIIMLALFMGYMYYRGEKVPSPVMQIMEEWKKISDSINPGGNTIDILNKKAGGKVQSDGSSRGSSSE